MSCCRTAMLVLLVALSAPAADAPSARLPRELPPEIYAWFWGEAEFRPEGYRRFLDQIAQTSNFGLLTTSLRVPAREIAFAETHDQVRRAVAYAHRLGLRVAFDLDVRLARGTFLQRFPGQQQWMLRVRRVAGPARTFTIAAQRLGDHMTGPDGQYEVLSGRLAGVFDGGGRPVEARATEQSARGVTVEFGETAGAAIVAGRSNTELPTCSRRPCSTFRTASTSSTATFRSMAR